MNVIPIGKVILGGKSVRRVHEQSSHECNRHNDQHKVPEVQSSPNSGNANQNDQRDNRQHVTCKRSEERRVGKECRSRWSTYHEKKRKRIVDEVDVDYTSKE